MFSQNLFSQSQGVHSMRERHLRIVCACLFLFMLDVLRPLGYSIHVDFSVIGIWVIYMIYPYFPALFWGVIFGYLRDCFSITTNPVNTIEAFFMFILIRYCLRQFPSKQTAIVLPVALIIIHTLANAHSKTPILLWYYILVFVQSIIIYYALKYLLTKWMKFQRVERS